VILVISEKEKDTSSTSGMETSKNTSELLGFRASTVVDKRMTAIKKAYLEKDFETFGTITMKDSNQFHATCLDTYPPIFYMNDTSHDVIRLCHVINKHFGKVVCAYTFDAGPNAVIYTLKQYVPMLLAVFSKFFPTAVEPKEYCNKPTEYTHAANNRASLAPQELLEKCAKTGRQCTVGDVKYCFVTRPGPGPVLQPLEESLIDLQTGCYKPPSDKHKRLNIGATNAAATNGTVDTSTGSCCAKPATGAGCCIGGANASTCAITLAVGAVAALAFVYSRKCCHK
jgi:diphosphomevalonate decarboxylase